MREKITLVGNLLELTKLQSIFPGVRWKLFLRSRKLSAGCSACTWGQKAERGGREEDEGGSASRAELSRELICSHGNPQSSREKNVGILEENMPRACVLVPKVTTVL